MSYFLNVFGAHYCCLSLHKNALFSQMHCLQKINKMSYRKIKADLKSGAQTL